MILIENSFFLTSQDSNEAVKIKDGLYIFLIVSLSGMGTANLRAAWAFTVEDAPSGNQIMLPNATAAELDGGKGATPYDQMIDKAEDIAIAYLQSFNPGCTFTKYH